MSIFLRLFSFTALALLAACSNTHVSEPSPAAKLEPAPPVAIAPARGTEPARTPTAAAAPMPAVRTEPTTGAAAAPTSGAPSAPVAARDAAAYGGGQLVAHEWGTNTVVVGTDGSLQRGMQHEGDDLPEFVYDRLKQGEVLGFPAVDKMETPVIYFYSDQPITLKVRVDMPRGVLTQWYPAVSAFAPPIYNSTRGLDLVDPVSDVDYVYDTQRCQEKYTAPAGGGVLDWGNVQVLARDAAPQLPAAPLPQFTWSYAREVAANPIRVDNPSRRMSPETVLTEPQHEKFLFYRGLGHFESPLLATTTRELVRLTERAEPIASPVWLLQVSGKHGSVQRLERKATGFEGALSPLAGLPLDEFQDTLAAELVDALADTGLYQDEAVAMVNTWRSQWFATQGVRVLYFAPDAWLARELPLTITPKPAVTQRVMVMRMELLTPQQEEGDVSALHQGLPAAREYFTQLGRFGEPRLRRAMVIGKAPEYSQQVLREIQGPNVLSALGE